MLDWDKFFFRNIKPFSPLIEDKKSHLWADWYISLLKSSLSYATGFVGKPRTHTDHGLCDFCSCPSVVDVHEKSDRFPSIGCFRKLVMAVLDCIVSLYYFLNILNHEWVSERVNTCLKLCRVSFSKRKRIRNVFFLMALWNIWIIYNFPIDFTFWARHHWFTKVKRVKHSFVGTGRANCLKVLHYARQLRFSQFTGASNYNEILYGSWFFPNRIPNLQWYGYISEQGPKCNVSAYNVHGSARKQWLGNAHVFQLIFGFWFLISKKDGDWTRSDLGLNLNRSIIQLSHYHKNDDGPTNWLSPSIWCFLQR